MTHRRTTPICKYCEEKPAKKGDWFCSERCAAAEGRNQMMAVPYDWCPKCADWHDSEQIRDCMEEEDR